MKMIFKAIVFIAFVAGIAACTKDEAETTGSIIGLVTRGDNGEPLDGVSVSLNPGGKTATTGSDGRYEFVSLEPQQYTVQLMKGGYKTSTRRITVVAGEVASGDVQLTAGEEEFDLSVSSLTFSESKTTSSFDILNISVSKEISFSILASYPSWLSVSEKSGRIPKGGQRSIVVKKINTPAVGSEGYITVEVAGSTKQIYVTYAAAAVTKGSVSGFIRDSDSGSALKNANVSLSPGEKSVTTGSDGSYRFDNLESGTYTVSVACSGYKSNSKTFAVAAGEVTSGDIALSPEAVDFRLSKTELAFTASGRLQSFDIVNLSSSRSVEWKILGSLPAWLSVSENSGTLLPSGQRAISVSLKSTPAKDEQGYITVEVAGSTKQVHVTFTAGGSGDGGGDVKEDYSSVQISQCDTRLKASVVSCQRVGSTVVFTCNLLNNGLGDVNDFRIYPPSSSSLISDGVRSKIIDDSQSDYPDATISFRGGSASSYRTIIGLLPDGVASKVVVTIGNVPGSVKKFSLIKLGVYAYPDSQYHLVNKYIDFKNVPVY
ncbi:carboxypeptidase regulatory-like domain-containing protein [Alistipes indistinctus]|uniref:carboxypeptidase regulatory-like domain-containing protein n=1 Tax=Alistipes indistinctus TaxID=626932 RepID=UPI003AB81FDA